MRINLEVFKSLFPKCKDPEILVNLFDNMLSPAGINTKNRIAGFLAQCGHESGGFTAMTENLNYSVQGLTSVFKKYFPTEESAKDYARKPEKIANKVYANRMGNGSESSGDGWKYRGRGYIMITGKANYSAFSKDTGIDIVTDPEKAFVDIVTSIRTAIWFWDKNKLNDFCDKDDIIGMTKKINGGTNGLEDRKKKYNELKKSL